MLLFMLKREKCKRKSIVISGVNLTEAGPLSILKDCLGYLESNLADKYNIIALVNSKGLINIDKITYYEFPQAKKCWLNRLYYEYIYFKKFSRRINPYLWFSLHDITPNIDAEIQAVYCHNPSPFYHLSRKDILLEPKFALFNKFYKFLYKINIEKNDFVVVQQYWLREHFQKLFHLSNNVVVAYPNIKHTNVSSGTLENSQSKTVIFFYPAFPRVFKNFEVICEAAKRLSENNVENFEVFLTINGSENKYSKYIYRKYKDVQSLRFAGRQTRKMVYEYYSKAKCLLFPSKLETCGLPIIEFKVFNKPILLANLQHCHEALGTYNKARFFDPNNPTELSRLMMGVIDNSLTYEQATKVEVENPFAENWGALFKILLKDNNG